MNAKLSIKSTPDIDYVIYTDASESGWGAKNNNNNNNFFILGKQIYNKIVAKIIKNNRIPKIKQTKYNIINRTKMLNRLVFHLTDQ